LTRSLLRQSLAASIKREETMKGKCTLVVVAALAAGGGIAFAAQDRYTVKVPDGLAFSEFKGYQDWQTVAVSETEGVLDVILGNPVMIKAYRAGGLPGVGKKFPDGAKMAKIHWKVKKSTEAPGPTTVPDTLRDIDFMVRDSKRFPSTGGWGYAQFNYDPTSATFTPQGTGAGCGFACHTIVKDKDYIFTAYPTR
jgi:hypothetical protein